MMKCCSSATHSRTSVRALQYWQGQMAFNSASVLLRMAVCCVRASGGGWQGAHEGSGCGSSAEEDSSRARLREDAGERLQNSSNCAATLT